MTIGEPRPAVEPVLSQLKDFQRDTVDYVFRRLYTDPDPTDRFLVADEVGLGKTLVARGVVARAVDHLWDDVKRIDVLYICSNLDIARQNVNRLKLPGRSDIPLASRITLLPTLIKDLTTRRLNFISFTPSTSLEAKSAMGTARERALLYLLLERAWDLRGVAPLNLLQGGVERRETFEDLVEWTRREQEIDDGITDGFHAALAAHDREADGDGLRERFDDLCRRFGRKRLHIPAEDRRDQRQLLGELRHRLATTCVTALEPDLVILDEFQRFRHVLHDDDPASELARDLFSWQCTHTGERARVLMLSATPYKMYTVAGEDEDDHHRDFLRTMRFLYDDDDREVDDLAAALRTFKEELFAVGDGQSQRLRAAREELETRLGRVMCRTERLGASADRNGMLVEREPDGVRLQAVDVRGYLGLQRVARELGEPDTIEYWKSAPYVLSFMDRYQLKRKFERACGDGHERHVLSGLANELSHAALPWPRVAAYEEVAAANPRLRALLRDLIDSNAWKLLWLPASLPYYDHGGAFAEPAAAGLTKRLIFSAWQVVPKAVAALLTYAAERRMMLGLEPGARNTPEARASRARLLDFRIERGRPAGMPTLALLYPSIALARACDPRAFAAGGPGDCSAKAALDWAEDQVRERLLPLLDRRETVWQRSADAIDSTLHPYTWQGRELDVSTADGVLHHAYHGMFEVFAQRTADELVDAGLQPGELRLAITLAERHDTPSAHRFAALCREALEAVSRERVDAADPEQAGAVDARWYWAAPIVLDLVAHTEAARRWFSQDRLAEVWIGEDAHESAASGWEQHVSLARRLATSGLDLGRQPDDLARVLAGQGLAGPGVTALRALHRAAGVGGSLEDVHARNAAARVAWGFRSLLNVPEVIALLRADAPSENYWQRVLAYCLEGNSQAMLDEYAHVLVEHLGLAGKSATEIVDGLADEMQAALMVRPSRLTVDEIAVDGADGESAQVRVAGRTMRARFAARFGEDASDDGGETTRPSQLRTAFNSPFWPFVMASTSVGQEGLDFHLYCHAVVHWNLPANPVDLEQREGRVHRYKGHAVRKNLARRHGEAALTDADPWSRVFMLGCGDRRPGDTELVPYWLYPIEGGAQIERHVPLLPLSRDQSRYEQLRRSLAAYRMAFGQSRQDDLVAYLLERLDVDQIRALLDDARLDLAPDGATE